MKRNWFVLLALGGIGLTSLGVGVIGAEAVKHTGGEEFCGSCHEMEPMVATFRKDIHGGNNPVGFKAECADCHLPHEGTLGYLVTKAGNGIRDIYKSNFTDTSKIDWHAKHDQRAHFVYDSGCLRCHQDLLAKTEAANPKSLELHAHYRQTQAGAKPLHCVSCHVLIGHNGELRSKLNETYPEYRFQQELREREAKQDGNAAAPP